MTYEANPIVVELTRGKHVESFYRGSYCVVDSSGTSHFERGQCRKKVFPRSAVKLAQALPLIESGTADAFGFSDEQLAVICSSHSGETGHCQTVADILDTAGIDVNCLLCGVHSSISETTALLLAKENTKLTPLHHNCSGKHAAMLSMCTNLKLPTKDYNSSEHPIQQRIADTLSDIFECAHDYQSVAIDNCSLPTYQVPIRNLALGFAKLCTGTRLTWKRAQASKRLLEACFKNPWFTAGTDRFDTDIMKATQGRVYSKIGAEAVAVAAIPEMSLGIALKIDDGNVRAARILLKCILAKIFENDMVLNNTIYSVISEANYNNKGELIGNYKAVLS